MYKKMLGNISLSKVGIVQMEWTPPSLDRHRCAIVKASFLTKTEGGIHETD